jgi:hypothetical protein
LSARYSGSPALHLKIGKSRLRALLYGALCLVTVYALWGIYARGYPIPALLLGVLAASLLWRLRDDCLVGTELRWQQGCWTLQQGTEQRRISLTQRSTTTRWVIYLAFSELPSGPGGQIWLYADSSSVEQLRRLRVRVALLQ